MVLIQIGNIISKEAVEVNGESRKLTMEFNRSKFILTHTN